MTKAEQLELREEWRKLIGEYRASGQSATAWCAAKGIKTNRLYYWLAQLEPSRKAKKPTEISNQWLPVMVNDHNPVEQPSKLMVRIGKATIEIRSGFDSQLLAETVRVLSALC